MAQRFARRRSSARDQPRGRRLDVHDRSDFQLFYVNCGS